MVSVFKFLFVKAHEELTVEKQRIDPEDPDSLGAVQIITHTKQDGNHIIWLQVYREGKRSSATTLLPQGLYIKFGKIRRPHLCLRFESLTNWKKLLLETTKTGNFCSATTTDISMTQ
jgi:hypothetical protein